MIDERNLGITEARLGLTILTCLLVALGYFVLQRLDRLPDSAPVATTPGAPDVAARTLGNVPAASNAQPQIVPVQGTESSPVPYPQTTLRPVWLAPQQNAHDGRARQFHPHEPTNRVGEPSRFDSEPRDSRSGPLR